MANREIAWIEALLFDKDKFSMEDTFSTIVRTAKNYKGKKYGDNEYKIVIHKGSHHRKESHIWEQLYKQFEAIEKYLGIKPEYYENKTDRYWRLIIDVRSIEGLPDFIEISRKDDSVYRIKINNARRYIKAFNRALKTYLYWCMAEHKNCNKLLVIPNACTDENRFYGFKFKDTELDSKRRQRN